MLRALICTLALMSLTACHAHDPHPGRGHGHYKHGHPGHNDTAAVVRIERDGDVHLHEGPGKKCPHGHRKKGWC